MNSYPLHHVRSKLEIAASTKLFREFIVALFLLISGSLTACGRMSSGFHEVAHVLLFTGTGTSSGGVAAIEAILDSSHITYSTVNSSDLNRMTETQISGYRLLIVPGGNFVQMGKSLSPDTTAGVRNAVKSGMNYLGLCAGGFLAGSFPAPYTSFDLSSGVQFGFYSAAKSGVRKAAVKITAADGTTLDQYWEDGPQFTGWGKVVAKYPDGAPAIVEASVGRGWVVLSGVHPEAPESWRRGIAFTTPVSADTEYARMLILAALNRTALPHY